MVSFYCSVKFMLSSAMTLASYHDKDIAPTRVDVPLHDQSAAADDVKLHNITCHIIRALLHFYC